MGRIHPNLLLLVTAFIWGMGFVAQRLGMEHMGPYGFNAARFFLGTLSLIPVWLMFEWRQRRHPRPVVKRVKLLKYGLLCGLCLFAGASLQQVGLQYTSVANAGFITGLYIVLIPVIGLVIKLPSSRETWLGVLLAAAGLYLLTMSETLKIAYGDLLQLLGAFFWAGHVLLVSRYSPRVPSVSLAMLQFGFCALASALVALWIETNDLAGLAKASMAIVYAGVFSAGIAFTLQIVAQRHAHPAHAALILSLEAVFAALGGWLLLAQTLSPRALLGCALMLAGCVLAQIRLFRHPASAFDTRASGDPRQ